MAQRKQRLAFFLPTLGGGGAERVFLNLAAGFDRRGYAVDLVLAQSEGAFLAELPELSPSIRVVALNRRSHDSGRTLSSLPALARYLRRERPAALLSGLQANFVAIWAGKLARTPARIVISEHNTFSIHNKVFPRYLRLGFALLMRLFYPWADRVIAVSQGVADDLSRVAGLPKARIQTVYNPIVTPELRAKAKAGLDHPWFQPGEPPVVLAVGRLSGQKDFSTLVRAFAIVHQARPVRLLILGEGEERPALEGLVRELGLEQDVSLPGFVPNPYPYLARAAAYVLSSRWEGLPTVLAEALYCHAPVIATDCPSGPREILCGGQHGRLVPVGDPSAMAQAIMEALDGRLPLPSQDSWLPFDLETVLDRYEKVLVSG